MGESYMQPASVISDAFRLLFSALDRVFYSLLGLVYELFFNVASADILSNETVMTFFGRVQLIIGVFMLFQLAMTILKGIVNPDSFTDAKSGAGNLVTRIITSLVLLTLLVPINIPNPGNEYEAQVNNNGVLFGTLYSLQHRLLANNTLGKLIFGNNSTDYVSANANTSELKKQSRVFTATVMKSFYRINLLPENQRTQHQEGKDDAIFNANRVCKDIDDSKLSAYLKEDADPGDIAGLVNETCTVSGGGLLGTKVYAFSSMPLLSLIVAIIFVFILLSFSVDVAVRAIKLAVLRLIAPIPIIGYMDPKGSKDSSFNAWTKTLTSTYLDLFIRLAAVYFVIFIISDMIYNGIYINNNGGLLGALTAVLIFIGLFVFAKQAPKFIKDVLGLKGDTGSLFGGLKDIVGVGAAGAGIGAAALGTIGSARTNYRASKEERDVMHPGSKWNGLLNVGSAIAGGISGGVVGAKAFMGKNGQNPKAVRAAQEQRNAQRAAHSTAWGRVREEANSIFTGQSLATNGNAVLEATSKAGEAIGKLKSITEEEGIKNGAAITNIDGNAIKIGGHTLSHFDGEAWNNAYSRATNGVFEYDGQTFKVNDISGLDVEAARKAQIQAWMDGGAVKSGGKTYAQISDPNSTEKLANQLKEVELNLKDADASVVAEYDAHSFKSYGKASGAATTYVINTKGGRTKEGMKQLMRNANAKNKK